MRKNFWGMLTAFLSITILITSCSYEDNPVEPVIPDSPNNLVDVVDDFWDVPGNAGNPAVVAALKSINNVTDLKPFMNYSLGQAYYFNYIQQVDHNNPSAGTFKQQVVLTFVNENAPTILHTEGYALAGDVYKNHNRMDSISAPHFLWALSDNYGKDEFSLNSVQVEYRYHGFSLPEGENNSFTYLNAEQQSKDLHAIVTDLKQALLKGKWLSTGVSKNGMTSAQYAYYDELNGWNDIDVYVPFVAPFPTRQWDPRIGTYMITQSSKEVQSDLEKAYKKLVNDQTIADSTVAAFKKVYEADRGIELSPDSAYLTMLENIFNNLFGVQSYGDFDTWKKFIPTEKSTTEEYVKFFMLTKDDNCIYRQTNAVRGPQAWREDPFEKQIAVDQGNRGLDYTWFLDGKLLTESDKQYLKDIMEQEKNSTTIELEVNLLKNLTTTTKKLIFVYGEDDPWTGAAIPDPTNPNVKKYIVPHGSHTDELSQYAWYPGGEEIAKKILADVKAILNQ
jgi:hypothetical protein